MRTGNKENPQRYCGFLTYSRNSSADFILHLSEGNQFNRSLSTILVAVDKKNRSGKPRYTTAQKPSSCRCFLPDLAELGRGSLHRTWAIRNGQSFRIVIIVSTESAGFHLLVRIPSFMPQHLLMPQYCLHSIFCCTERGGFAPPGPPSPKAALARFPLTIESPA